MDDNTTPPAASLPIPLEQTEKSGEANYRLSETESVLGRFVAASEITKLSPFASYIEIDANDRSWDDNVYDQFLSYVTPEGHLNAVNLLALQRSIDILSQNFGPRSPHDHLLSDVRLHVFDGTISLHDASQLVTARSNAERQELWAASFRPHELPGTQKPAPGADNLG